MSEQNKKTKKILLIGNGFDLRTGVKTTFRDFFRFVIYGVIWHNYNKSELFRDRTSAWLPPETKYEEFFDEEKIKVVANIQREKERKKWIEENQQGELYPSEHPLEILSRLNDRDSIAENCRKLIETEFGQKFIKRILNRNKKGQDNELVKALTINLTTQNLPADLKSTGSVYYGIYGLLNNSVAITRPDLIPSDTNLGCGLETIAYIYEAYLDKNWSNIALWSDVETVIELLITGNKNLITKYNVSKNELPKWNDETLKSFSEGLDIFELLLTKYLDAITQMLDIEKRFGSAPKFLESIYRAHEKSMRMRCLIRISQELLMNPWDLLDFLRNPDVVINYNYTDIAERIYKNIANPIYIHINGEINPRAGFEPSYEGFTTNIVIGYTNHNKSNVPKDLYHIEKSSRRIVKNTEFFRLKQNTDKVATFDLLIIGHSCCTADSDIIGNLLTHPKLNKALILCHTKDDLISINNNLKQILDPEIYGNLMTHETDKIGPSLFFAVEQPKKNNKDGRNVI